MVLAFISVDGKPSTKDSTTLTVKISVYEQVQKLTEVKPNYKVMWIEAVNGDEVIGISVEMDIKTPDFDISSSAKYVVGLEADVFKKMSAIIEKKMKSKLQKQKVWEKVRGILDTASFPKNFFIKESFGILLYTPGNGGNRFYYSPNYKTMQKEYTQRLLYAYKMCDIWNETYKKERNISGYQMYEVSDMIYFDDIPIRIENPPTGKLKSWLLSGSMVKE